MLERGQEKCSAKRCPSHHDSSLNVLCSSSPSARAGTWPAPSRSRSSHWYCGSSWTCRTSIYFIFPNLLQGFRWSAKKGPFRIWWWLQDQSPLLYAWNPSELWARAELALGHQGDTWWWTDPAEHHASAPWLEGGSSNSSWSGGIGTTDQGWQKCPRIHQQPHDQEQYFSNVSLIKCTSYWCTLHNSRLSVEYLSLPLLLLPAFSFLWGCKNLEESLNSCTWSGAYCRI